MYDIWNSNFLNNSLLVKNNKGPQFVTVVSGSEIDQNYWKQRFLQTRHDMFRQNGETTIVSVYEKCRKGNFYGTFKAWIEAKNINENSKGKLPQISLISMVFGKGTRLSPFTQTLGNRKTAFPTPKKALHADTYMNTAELSNFYSNIWINHLKKGGFQGTIIKWGDEAIIPGILWESKKEDFKQFDAMRFIWQTEVTKELAQEKEWILFDAQNNLMKYQFARQQFGSLKQRLAKFNPTGKYRVGVNIGSLALSYEFLDTAIGLLRQQIEDPNIWLDWDPYVWMALCCQDYSEWRSEVEHELKEGITGIQTIENRYPRFYEDISNLRNAIEAKLDRKLRIGVLDFGEALWIDVGLHFSLRNLFETLIQDNERGKAVRKAFGIPNYRDNNGNILVNSELPESADIRDSIIIDTIIRNSNTLIHNGFVIGGCHDHLVMPYGGSVLFSAADFIEITGPHAIAFRSIGSEIIIGEGERHTTVLLPQGPEHMVTNESVEKYDKENYFNPILGNRLSFEAAGNFMEKVDAKDLEIQWLKARKLYCNK